MPGSLVKPPACPSCNASANHRVRRPRRSSVQIWKCDQCRFIFCFPLPIVESLSAGRDSVLTDESYTAGLLTLSETQIRQYHRLAEARYQRYSATLGKRNYRLLEIGCGSCGLAGRYRELGVEYHGIDLDPRVVEAAQRAGIEHLRTADFFDLSSDEKFDVITFSQVLEHIKTPRRFLAKVHAMVVSGGVVHCDVPNQNSVPSLLHRLPISRDRWGAVAYPHHLFAYSKHSLQALFGALFSVDVFDSTVSHATWGQATCSSKYLAMMSPLLEAVHGGSLLVAYGTKR